MKKDVRKDYKVFAMHVLNNEQVNNENKLGLEDILILQDFVGVFIEEILGFPPKQDLDFTIELVLGAIPNSKDPHQMEILGLKELKLQLQELIDKN